MNFLVSFFVKFDEVKSQDPAMATTGILKVGYLRNYCGYFLQICIDGRMKTSFSENEIKLKKKIKVSTRFLTAPRKLITFDFCFYAVEMTYL